MRLVIGLGNPNEEYSKSRHNVGFILVDELVSKEGLGWEYSKKFGADMAVSSDTIFAKPQTFMNNSGKAVSKILSFYKIPLENLIVIHDDIDLPFGEVKKQLGVGAAGHHGVESIIANVKSQDFLRIRFGIGRPTDNSPVEDWVLKDFSEKELENVKNKALKLSL